MLTDCLVKRFKNERQPKSLSGATFFCGTLGSGALASWVLWVRKNDKSAEKFGLIFLAPVPYDGVQCFLRRRPAVATSTESMKILDIFGG